MEKVTSASFKVIIAIEYSTSYIFWDFSGSYRCLCQPCKKGQPVDVLNNWSTLIGRFSILWYRFSILHSVLDTAFGSWYSLLCKICVFRDCLIRPIIVPIPISVLGTKFGSWYRYRCLVMFGLQTIHVYSRLFDKTHCTCICSPVSVQFCLHYYFDEWDLCKLRRFIQRQSKAETT